jgi:outer membrane immunogenic protein
VKIDDDTRSTFQTGCLCLNGVSMKKLLLGMTAVAAYVLASAAQAADLPSRNAPPPVVAPPFSWTGFYVGLHVASGWGTKEWSDGREFNISNLATTITSVPGPLGSYNINGFLGGGQIGYNLQVGWAVFGIEADASWADIKGSGICFPLQCSTKIDTFGTITGRFGVAIDRALLYVKGGGAWVRERHTTSFGVAPVFSSSASDTRWGWATGAGIEYAFSPNWSGKIEYSFLDFGKEFQTFLFPDLNAPANGTDLRLRQTLHTVKIGLNYRF